MEQIQPLVEGQVRDVKDARTVKIKVEPDMITMRPQKGSRLLEVPAEAARKVASFAGLPLTVARSLSPHTFGLALNELLTQKEHFTLITLEDQVTDIVPYKSRHNVDPGHLLDIVEKVLPVQDYLRVRTQDRTATIEIVGQKTEPVVRGDLVRAGVLVAFSPMGVTLPMVQSYAMVLACTNGATSNRVLSKFTGGSGGDGIWDFFRSSIRRAYGAFNSVVEEWKHLQQENIAPEDRAAMLEALIKKAQLPQEVAEAVRAMAIERPPENSWQLHNLITYASSHLLSAPKKIERAQSVAADFADEVTHARTCPLCHRER